MQLLLAAPSRMQTMLTIIVPDSAIDCKTHLSVRRLASRAIKQQLTLSNLLYRHACTAVRRREHPAPARSFGRDSLRCLE